ncbi:MAG: isochorismatase [Anaerolineales bacterium]|nr:isochorismatase [Anaerolineales bacterium]
MATLPLPPHFEAAQVGQIWRVPYEARAAQARQWAAQHALPPAAEDTHKTALVLIDVQNTFCLPDFELFVGGRTGTGAVDDNVRLCEFIYRHLGQLTSIIATLDTHTAMQIFHAVFLVDDDGKHPGPMTMVTSDDLRAGKWHFNPALAESLNLPHGAQHLAYYTTQLEAREKYALTIWPYHAMLGGLGHALVPAVEEALFFHSLARYSPTQFILKGQNPLTEAYSAVGPEITQGAEGQTLATRSKKLLEIVQTYDTVLIAGQAKSHCVAWTVSDLLDDLGTIDPTLAQKITLLEDCTSPVVVPGVVDFTDAADAAYARFAEAGMRVVKASDWEALP